jgi:hypothetical protein
MRDISYWANIYDTLSRAVDDDEEEEGYDLRSISQIEEDFLINPTPEHIRRLLNSLLMD